MTESETPEHHLARSRAEEARRKADEVVLTLGRALMQEGLTLKSLPGLIAAAREADAEARKLELKLETMDSKDPNSHG